MPILIFFVSHTFQMLRVIREVIDGGHGSELVESFDQHTFMIHIRKSQRAVNLFHSLFFSPFFNGVEQSVYDFCVIDEIQKTEAGALLVPHFVTTAVNHSGNTADDFTVFVGKKIDGIANFECRILLLVQCNHLLLDQSRYMVGVVFI